MRERQHAVSDMDLDSRLFSSLFAPGDEVPSGGPPEHKNAARLEIIKIEDCGVRVKAIKAKKPVLLKFVEMQAVYQGIEVVNPKSIQTTIQPLLKPLSASGKPNTSTENYLYGFAREIIARLGEAAVPLEQSSATEASTSPADTAVDTAGTAVFEEGELFERWVKERERDPAAIERCKEIHGVVCKACGFNFEFVYGPRGRGFIHVHHLNPLALSDGKRAVDPERDLIPLCPNCHAMVHKGDLLTLEELKQRVRDARAERCRGRDEQRRVSEV